jgi:hypothetical protein
MANKTNLQHKRKETPSLPELVEQLIDRSVDGLSSGETKASVSDLIRMVHLRQKLFPEVPEPGLAVWVDSW